MLSNRMRSLAPRLLVRSSTVRNAPFNTRLFHSSTHLRAMKVPIDEIKKLRHETDAPLGQCKKALEETNGDMDAAKEWLRKKGVQTAEKKSDRDASQGLVIVGLSDSRKSGVIVEINSETDFVTRNEKFQTLAAEIATVALEKLESEKNDQFDLKEATLANGTKVSTAIAELSGQVGENIVLRRWKGVRAPVSEDGHEPGNGLVYSYVHNQYTQDAGTMAALVLLRLKKDSNAEEASMDSIGFRLAMRIAGFQPKYISVEHVPAELVEKEKEILKERNLSKGRKLEHMDKIIAGQMKSFYEEMVLLEQDWGGEPPGTVKRVLEEEQMEVVDFVRFQCGEKLSTATPVKE